MPGQRPFIRVVNAPSQLPEGGANFTAFIQTNMLDPRADIDVQIDFEPLPGCDHSLCHEQHRTDFHGDFAKRVTIGRGKDRMQQLKMICALLPPKRTCGLWRINATLYLPSLEEGGEDRFIARTAHPIIHNFIRHPKPQNPTGELRAFTIYGSQRPNLRVVKTRSVMHKSGQFVPVTLETDLIEPALKIRHVARPINGRDYDDLKQYPDQYSLDIANEAVFTSSSCSDPTTVGQQPNVIQQYTMNANFDKHGKSAIGDKYRIIFELYRPAQSDFEDDEVLATATHKITFKGPQQHRAPGAAPKKPHGKARKN